MNDTTKMFYQQILDAMQSCEELGGPEGYEYIDLMETVSKVAAQRAINARQNLRHDIAAEFAQNIYRHGQRVVARTPIDRFPYFICPKGMTGTVERESDTCYWVRMDHPVAGADDEDWDNRVQYVPGDDSSMVNDWEAL